MELRDALTLFWKRRAFVAVLIIIVVGGSFLWSYLRPVRYTTSISFAINRVNKQQTADYQYDGYYALQAADLFAQTVVSWLQTPSVLVEIYDKAGLHVQGNSVRSLTSHFKTKKYAAQNVVLTYASATEEEANRLAKATEEVLTVRTASVNRDVDDAALFEVVASKPVIVRSEPNPFLIGIVSFIVGLVLALFFVPVVAYLSGPGRTT